jgi:hypothetical protein
MGTGVDITMRALEPASRTARDERARVVGARVFDGMFGPVPRVLAAIALVASAIMPPHGLGFSLCVFQRLTGLECPGCGLTRSVACITHLEPAAAFRYHPFGFVAYAALLAASLSMFAPARLRARVRAWFLTNGTAANAACWAVVLLLLAFGVARLAVEWRSRGSFAV